MSDRFIKQASGGALAAVFLSAYIFISQIYLLDVVLSLLLCAALSIMLSMLLVYGLVRPPIGDVFSKTSAKLAFMCAICFSIICCTLVGLVILFIGRLEYSNAVIEILSIVYTLSTMAFGIFIGWIWMLAYRAGM